LLSINLLVYLKSLINIYKDLYYLLIRLIVKNYFFLIFLNFWFNWSSSI